MRPAPLASVVIRSKDEAASIGTTLRALAAQTVADRLEVIVVDSGSSDGTVAIAREAGARVLQTPRSITSSPLSATWTMSTTTICSRWRRT
jgi:glycosyltransferase involved in cell wall biosynthesis